MTNITEINTSNTTIAKTFIKKLHKPDIHSHKGQNGKLLIIGGSSLFHAASLWAAMIASKIVDIVHYASTKENQKIFINLKSKWVNGIVIKQRDINSYIIEDDSILIGPGMLRGNSEEAAFGKKITENALLAHPNKQFILDAGSLQTISSTLFQSMSKKPVITPHREELKELFFVDISNKKQKMIASILVKLAYKHNCIIHLKMVHDYITDGSKIFIIKGGNPGLTKGGSGDVLAGLIAALSTKNDPFLSCITSSILLKRSADNLYKDKNTWYSITELIEQISFEFQSLNKNN